MRREQRNTAKRLSEARLSLLALKKWPGFNFMLTYWYFSLEEICRRFKLFASLVMIHTIKAIVKTKGIDLRTHELKGKNKLSSVPFISLICAFYNFRNAKIRHSLVTSLSSSERKESSYSVPCILCSRSLYLGILRSADST